MNDVKIRKSNRQQRKLRRRHPEPISRQETKVMEHVRKGLTHKEIGAKMFIAPSTVSTHVRNISRKWQTKNEPELVDKYLHRKYGLFDF